MGSCFGVGVWGLGGSLGFRVLGCQGEGLRRLRISAVWKVQTACKAWGFTSILVSVDGVGLSGTELDLKSQGRYNPKPWVLPCLINSWIIIMIGLYIALNMTPNVDCYWEGAVPNLNRKL